MKMGKTGCEPFNASKKPTLSSSLRSLRNQNIETVLINYFLGFVKALRSFKSASKLKICSCRKSCGLAAEVF